MSYSLYRVWNAFEGLQLEPHGDLYTKSYKDYNAVVKKVFNCQKEHEANFCLEILHKEMWLAQKDATPIIQNVIPMYRAHLNQEGYFDGAKHEKLEVWLDGRVNTAAMKAEAEELQEMFGEIMSKIKAELEKTEDENTKKVWAYILHSLNKVELILKNYDKLSLEFAIEECHWLYFKKDENDKGGIITQWIDKAQAFAKKYGNVAGHQALPYLIGKEIEVLIQLGSEITKSL